MYFLDCYGIQFELFYELDRAYPYNRGPVIIEAVDRTRSINVCGLQHRKHTGRAYNLACSRVQVGVLCIQYVPHRRDAILHRTAG